MVVSSCSHSDVSNNSASPLLQVLYADKVELVLQLLVWCDFITGLINMVLPSCLSNDNPGDMNTEEDFFLKTSFVKVSGSGKNDDWKCHVLLGNVPCQPQAPLVLLQDCKLSEVKEYILHQAYDTHIESVETSTCLDTLVYTSHRELLLQEGRMLVNIYKDSVMWIVHWCSSFQSEQSLQNHPWDRYHFHHWMGTLLWSLLLWSVAASCLWFHHQHNTGRRKKTHLVLWWIPTLL